MTPQTQIGGLGGDEVRSQPRAIFRRVMRTLAWHWLIAASASVVVVWWLGNSVVGRAAGAAGDGAASAFPALFAGYPVWQWSVLVAVATLLITVVSMLPGMCLPLVVGRVANRSVDSDSDDLSPAGSSLPRAGSSPHAVATRAQLFLIGCTLAMAIRGGATVALVVACRYKIAVETEEVASMPLVSMMIGLWYVAMTFDEVRLLAIGGRSLDAQSVKQSPSQIPSK